MELDHFYRAELQCEQRASWLLTISFGVLALVFNAFAGIGEHKYKPEIQPWLVVCVVLLFVTIAAALLTLWPLAGWEGKLQPPFTPGGGSGEPPAQSRIAITTWARHYGAHRIRAARKTNRVVVTLVFLTLGAIAGAAAAAKNLGVF